MTPLSSIATIDDLIVALLRLGYKKIYEEYNRAAMTAYPQLTNADIDNILALSLIHI